MITEKDFLHSLDEVIEKKDKIIVLYSGLWTFINKINFNIKKNNQIPTRVLELIEKKVGKKRTLLLPSFSGKEFQRKKFIDLNKSIDKENGILPRIALNRKYYRTPQPIHSYLAFGNIKKIKKLKLESSWGKYSILEFLSKHNARICNLGLPWNEGCAYLHRFEEIYNVPWRYHKTFKGKIKKNNKIIGVFYETKFCSPKNGVLKYDFNPFIKKIKNSKTFKKTKNKKFSFESIKASCLDKIGKSFFSKNPWIIVKNKKQTLYWINKKKDNELYKSINDKNE